MRREMDRIAQVVVDRGFVVMDIAMRVRCDRRSGRMLMKVRAVPTGRHRHADHRREGE